MWSRAAWMAEVPSWVYLMGVAACHAHAAIGSTLLLARQDRPLEVDRTPAPLLLVASASQKGDSQRSRSCFQPGRWPHRPAPAGSSPPQHQLRRCG